MIVAGRPRRILIGTLVGAVLLILPWLTPNSNGSFLDPMALLLMIAGVMVLGICVVELVTNLWLKNGLMHVLAWVLFLFSLFVISTYLAILGKLAGDTSITYELLANIFGGYLLVSCWAYFANAIDKPFTRSRAMAIGALANLLIGLFILLELSASEVFLIDRELMILALTIVSSSLAWSSVIEIENAEKSSNKRIGAWRAIQAVFYTFIAPISIVVWMVMSMGFSYT